MDSMVSINNSFVMAAVVLAVVLCAAASPQTRNEKPVTNLCDVVASPDEYNQKTLTVEGVLFPSEHSLALYSPSCKPREGFDVTIQAVLPSGWESLSNGKQLRKLLKNGKETQVRVSGTFQSGAGRYGPDISRFRFVVSSISSVQRVSVPR